MNGKLILKKIYTCIPYLIVAVAVFTALWINRAMIPYDAIPYRNMRAYGMGNEELFEYLAQKGLQPDIDMTVDLTAAKQAACDYLNTKYRVPEGLQPVELDESLCKYADIRAKEAYYKWSHERPDGTYLPQILFDISHQSISIGENLSTMNIDNKGMEGEFGWYPDSTVEDQLKMHIDSYTLSDEGHYENMMHPDNSKCGIGVFYDEEHHLLYICDLYMN